MFDFQLDENGAYSTTGQHESGAYPYCRTTWIKYFKKLKTDENWNLSQGGGGVESNTTQQIPITEWEFTIGTTEGTDMIGTKK